MNLSGKLAIVTGASSGIGRDFCRALVEKGAAVYGLARRKEKLDEVRVECGEAFRPVVLDVSDAAAVDRWVSATFPEAGLPDILVNNAGVATKGTLEELDDSKWDRMIATNTSGVFYLTRRIVPLMKQNPQVCHIVNIASIAGRIGNPGLSGYNASKFALRGFSEALFKELRHDGIKVSCLFPGSIATRFFETSGMGEVHPNMMMPRDVTRTLIHLLETPDTVLIDEVVMRPLVPRPPGER